jgi:hypothetical protein
MFSKADMTFPWNAFAVRFRCQASSPVHGLRSESVYSSTRYWTVIAVAALYLPGLIELFSGHCPQTKLVFFSAAHPKMV